LVEAASRAPDVSRQDRAGMLVTGGANGPGELIPFAPRGETRTARFMRRSGGAKAAAAHCGATAKPSDVAVIHAKNRARSVAIYPRKGGHGPEIFVGYAMAAANGRS
jgi:hypothetical protein